MSQFLSFFPKIWSRSSFDLDPILSCNGLPTDGAPKLTMAEQLAAAKLKKAGSNTPAPSKSAGPPKMDMAQELAMKLKKRAAEWFTNM